jgi:hypothetical protein
MPQQYQGALLTLIFSESAVRVTRQQDLYRQAFRVRDASRLGGVLQDVSGWSITSGLSLMG